MALSCLIFFEIGFGELQQLFMWRLSRALLVLLLLNVCSCSYLQFQLVRLPSESGGIELEPVTCKNESAINQDAEYKQACYEKDISYIIPFVKDGLHVALAADLTAPLSWIKGPDCAIEGTSQKCKMLRETFAEKVKSVKRRVAGKLKKDKKDEQKEDAIIEGSSEVIRGEFERSKSVSFTTRDSSRLNNFFELIMLGLFIYGEKDHLQLESTNFISATSISKNLNGLMDGAISMRFDSTSENSFLNEIFSYVKATEKTICIYLGSNRTLTIGDMTAKFTQSGYSSINWISMPDDEGFGKMPQVSDIGVEDMVEDNEEDNDETLPAVFTLSASYIGLPGFVIDAIFAKSFSKFANCTVNNKTLYVECSTSSKKNMEKILERNLYFGFQGPNMMVSLKDLLLRNEHSKKATFNIKRTYNNRIILGEPIYDNYVLLLDYTKNRIGFAPKRVNFSEFFVNVVTLVRFLCLIFVLGCAFIICYQPCRKCLRALADRKFFTKGVGSEGKRLRQYAPIQENPYQDLKGKIQDVISSTEKEVEGI